MPANASRQLSRGWKAAVIFPMLSGFAFLGSASLGLWLNRSTEGIAALWPANAVLLSVLILSDRTPRRYHLLSCAIAGVVSNWMDGTNLVLSAVFALSNLLSSVITFRMLTSRPQSDLTFESFTSLTRLFVASIVGVTTGATLACSAVWLMSGNFTLPWLSWTASDMLGMLLVTPLVITYARRAREIRNKEQSGPSWRRTWPLIAVLAVCVLVFDQSQFPLLFLPLALVMVATFRLGLLGAIAGTTIVAVTGLLLMGIGHGPTALIYGSVALRIQFFQFYLLTVYATSMPIAALMTERARLASERSESDRRHRRILDRSREVIFESDLAGQWTYLNPAWEFLTGRSVDTSIGQSLLTILHPAEREPALERLAPLYRQEADDCQQDLRYVHTDGRVLWVAMRSHLLADAQGSVIGTYGTLHDVTRRVSVQAAQVESERRYRLLADHSNDMIVQFGISGVREYVSPASLALLGYTPEELTGQPAAGAIHPDDRATVLATCRTLLDGAENPICSYRQLHKNGLYVWLEASYRIIRDEATGELTGFIASVRDISRRAKAELDRSRSAAKLEGANRLLLMAEEMSAVGHWQVDVASGMAFWSDMVCSIHGRPAGYIPSVEAAIDVYHPDDRAAVQAAVAEAISTGRGYSMSCRIIRPDGVVRHVVTTGRAEIGPDGSVTELFGVIQDVTEAYEAQQALIRAGNELASSNSMLTMAEAVASLGHWRIDQVDNSLFWSEETYRIYGVSPWVTPSLDSAYAQYHPDDVDHTKSVVRQALMTKTGYSSRARIIRPDGAERHILTRGEIQLGGDGEPVGVFGIVQDITDEVVADNLRKAQAEQYFFITQQASDMISMSDAKGVCHFVSPSSKAILGYDPEELIGTTPYDYALEEDYPLLDQQRRELVARPAGEVVQLRFRMRRKDGAYVWMDVAGRIASHGDEIRIISVCRDISTQVATEKELRDARRQAEAAVIAKSSFLANMSHEIRTPMNGVVGFAELLLAGALDDEQRRQAELIADSGRAMMQMLNDILDLSKVEAGQMTVSNEPFDIIDTLNACIALVSPAIEQKGIELQSDFSVDLPRVLVGDALRVRQIALNLLGNAAKFTLAGSITLAASIDGDGRLIIAVRDTGIGIAADRQQAIFEQFAQADDGIAQRFGGTGLGLSISSQLAVLMGGSLTLESEAGHGSCFTLTLPLAAAEPLTTAQAHKLPAPITTSARRYDNVRILVAEDHEVNQRLISAMLSKLGCTADLAADGHDAITMIEAAAAQRRPYSLVFMDMQMPSMNGLEATRAIRASGTCATMLPIIALTANALPDDIQACLNAGMQAHVAKPFSLTILKEALGQWLPIPVSSELPDDTDFDADIQRRYRTKKIETLRRVDALIRAGTFTDIELAEVASMLHQLAGTAGMFGEGVLSVKAALLETELHNYSGADMNETILRAAKAVSRAAKPAGSQQSRDVNATLSMNG